MRTSTLTILGASLIAGALSAQAAPGIVKAHADSKTFTKTQFAKQKLFLASATRNWIAQISMAARAGLPAGKVMCATTVYGLDSAYGNTAQSQTESFVLLGEYDETNDKFTPNKQANALNDSAGGNFGLMLGGPLGKYAVVDHSDGPYFSRRNNFTQAFPKPVKIGGITATYVDPSVCFYEGKLKLLWVDTYTLNSIQLNRIILSDLDDSKWPTSVTIKGTGRIIADVTLSKTAAGGVHSPTPVVNGKGSLVGLMCSERVGNDSDQFWKGDIAMGKGHEQQRYYDGSAWTNNGSGYSGTLYYADSESTVTPFYESIKQSGVAWLAIPEFTVGGKGSVMMAVEDVNAGTNVTALLLGPAGLIPGVAIPGINGKLGLNPAGVVVLNVVAHAAGSERGSLPLALPNDSSLKGKSFAFQGLSIDPAAGSNPQIMTFTNTAWLNVK